MSRKPLAAAVNYYCEECGAKWWAETRDVLSCTQTHCIECFGTELRKDLIITDEDRSKVKAYLAELFGKGKRVE